MKATKTPQGILNSSKRLDFLEALYRLAKSAECQEHLVPYLREALQNKWLDPLTYPSQEKFLEDYNYNRAKASVFSEIIKLLTPEAIKAQIDQIRRYQLEHGQE